MAELQEPESSSRSQLRRISECDKEHLDRSSSPTHLQESKVLVLYTGGELIFSSIFSTCKTQISLGTIGMKSCDGGN